MTSKKDAKLLAKQVEELTEYLAKLSPGETTNVVALSYLDDEKIKNLDEAAKLTGRKEFMEVIMMAARLKVFRKLGLVK